MQKYKISADLLSVDFCIKQKVCTSLQKWATFLQISFYRKCAPLSEICIKKYVYFCRERVPSAEVY
jgi:hypothetical protein